MLVYVATSTSLVCCMHLPEVFILNTSRAQLQIILVQHRFFSTFIWTIGLILLLLKRLSGSNITFLPPYAEHGNLIFWMSQQYGWWLLYLLPIIIIFPELSTLARMMSLFVAIRIDNRVSYCLSTLLSLFILTLSVNLSLICFVSAFNFVGFDLITLIAQTFSVYVTLCLFYMLGTFLSPTYAMILICFGIFSYAKVQSLFLIGNTGMYSLNENVQNIFINFCYFILIGWLIVKRSLHSEQSTFQSA